MATTIFGISNCDTIKKAKKWLEQQDVEYTFHDYRKDGLDRAWLEQTELALGWETMVNKRGTTYRQLDDEVKAGLSQQSALDLMQEYPAMIKRPILQHNGLWYVGFKSAEYEEIFA
ncbi:ArsC family reductase [Salinimonas lutimaris]|uniref:ArsC family reductase n=1 Tax=Salinimonas lutimaris TaxID=914153 RepID=UPI0010C0EE5F|nr:ArsC family reductase [Salinimonas lutimaris]